MVSGGASGGGQAVLPLHTAQPRLLFPFVNGAQGPCWSWLQPKIRRARSLLLNSRVLVVARPLTHLPVSHGSSRSLFLRAGLEKAPRRRLQRRPQLGTVASFAPRELGHARVSQVPSHT